MALLCDTPTQGGLEEAGPLPLGEGELVGELRPCAAPGEAESARSIPQGRGVGACRLVLGGLWVKGIA